METKLKKTILLGVLLLMTPLVIGLSSKDGPEYIPQFKPKGYIGKAAINFVWEINKTGLERNTNIYYEILNQTSTKFCIGFHNIEEYKQDLILGNHDFKKIPLNKLSTENGLIIKQSNIDISKLKDNEEFCFNVEYPELKEGLTFKVGFMSVLIDGSAVTTANQYNSNENIVRSSDNNLYVAYEGLGDDLAFGNSSNGGLSWSNKDLDTSAHSNIGIVLNSSDDIFVYARYDTLGSAISEISSNGGVSFSRSTIKSSVGTISCVSDSSDFHCCLTTGGVLEYANKSSGWAMVELADANDDIDYCDIEVDDSNNVWVVGTGTDQDDLDLFVRNASGWQSRIQLHPNVENWHPSIALDQNNDAWIAYNRVGDLDVINISLNNLANWTQFDVDDSGYAPDIFVVDNKVHILYCSFSRTCSSSSIDWANSTMGKDWTTRILGSGYFPSSAQTRNPTSNNPVNNFSFTYADASSDYYYDYNFTGFEGADSKFPVVNLENPTYAKNYSHSQIVNFNCSASDDSSVSNVSLYWNHSGSWVLNETNTSGINGTYIFDIKITKVGDFVWNCESCDTLGNCGFNTTNYTFSLHNYSVDFIDPLTIRTLSVVSNQNVSLNFTIQKDGVNLTSVDNITSFLNVTFDNTFVNIRSGDGGCEGTLDCTSFTTEASCENCSQCNWTVSSQANIEVLYDDFDRNGDGADNWILQTWAEYSSATYCVNDDDDDCVYEGHSQNSNIIYRTNLSMGGCINGTAWVSGTFYDYGADSGENLNMYLNGDGSDTFPYLTQISDGNGAGKQNFNHTITDETLLTDTFRILFQTQNLDSSEYYFLDDIRIHCTNATYSCSNTPSGACSSCSDAECSTNCSAAGCSIGSANQFNFLTNYFQLNATAANFASGKKDVKINISIDGLVINTTELDAVDYGSVSTPCNCTFPTSCSNNKVINFSCSCNTTSYSCANIVSYVGSGPWMINATVNVSSFGTRSAGQNRFFGSLARVFRRG